MARSKVNSAVGLGLGLAVVPTEQVIPALWVLIVWMLLLIFRQPFLPTTLFSSAVFAAWWIVTGNDPWSLTDRLLHGPRKWIAFNPDLDGTKHNYRAQQPPKPAMVAKVMGKKQTLWYIEPNFHLVTYGQIVLEHSPGFYMLQRKNDYMFIFAWELEGYSPSLPDSTCREILENLANALRNLPSAVDLKIELSSQSNLDELLAQQEQLLQSETRDALEHLLIRSQQSRFQGLHQLGLIQRKRIRIFAKCRVNAEGRPEGFVEQFIYLMGNKVQKVLSGLQGDNPTAQAWSTLIAAAYERYFQPINALLSDATGFGLAVTPLSAQDLYRSDYAELHAEPAPAIPQLIVYNRDGLQDPLINTNKHVLATLFAPERGVDAQPQTQRNWIYLPTKDEYHGAMQLVRANSYPDDGRGQLGYIWDLLLANDPPLGDFKLVTDIRRDTSGLNRWMVDLVINNSTKREASAALKGSVDVTAGRRLEEGIKALDRFEEGDQVFYCASVLWLRRKRPDDLRQDLDALIRRIPTAATRKLVDCTEHAWLQTWPFHWEALLTYPTDRRSKYFASQITGVMSLMRQPTLDPHGLTLFSRDGSPVQLKITGDNHHLGIVATNRAGKSILLESIILEFYLRRYPIVLYDFPRPDGSSTYKDLVETFESLGAKAAYFDIQQTSQNILEMPDLRAVKQISQKAYADRLLGAIDYQLSILKALVIGDIDDSILDRKVGSLLSLSYNAFLAEPGIQARHDAAIAGGRGSTAWANVPILQDYIDFFEIWAVQYLEDNSVLSSDITKSALDMILSELKGVLSTRLGRAIGQPSNFDSDVDFLVMALANVSSDFETSIYALSGYGVLLRRALSSPQSAFIVDEGTILFQRPSFAARCGETAANGAKWGCHFIFGAQTIREIRDSVGGNAIFSNVGNLMVGHIKESAVGDLAEQGFNERILRKYATANYRPNKTLIRSYWYLKRDDQHMEVCHCPSHVSLAIGATNTDEDQARQRFLRAYGDPVEAILNFSEAYADALKTGIPMDSIHPQLEANYEETQTPQETLLDPLVPLGSHPQ